MTDPRNDAMRLGKRQRLVGVLYLVAAACGYVLAVKNFVDPQVSGPMGYLRWLYLAIGISFTACGVYYLRQSIRSMRAHDRHDDESAL